MKMASTSGSNEIKSLCPRGSFGKIFLLTTIIVILSFCFIEITYIDDHLFSKTHFPFRKESIKGTNASTVLPSPWEHVPSFQLYLRTSSFKRFITEYRRWFVKSYKHFFPPDKAESALILVLDGESPKDQAVGSLLNSLWPYPKICFQFPAEDPSIYEDNLRYRSYYDQFHPERCTDAEYVGFVDSDTMWTSLVTPGSLFEDGKPVVNARMGSENRPCWGTATRFLLGEQQVPQCMAYFPVLIKVSHIIEMRQFIAKRFGTSFDEAFKRSLKFGMECLCQYSIFCNYIWYHKRDQYSFHLQMSPDNNWDGKANYVPDMASLQFLRKEIPKELTLPKPRVAIHVRYLSTRSGRAYYDKDSNIPPMTTELNLILSESFCYNGGFERCPLGCKQFNQTNLFFNLFVFEWWQWRWDKRCYGQQLKYLQEVKEVVNYYEKSRNWLLGVSSTDELCWLIS